MLKRSAPIPTIGDLRHDQTGRYRLRLWVEASGLILALHKGLGGGGCLSTVTAVFLAFSGGSLVEHVEKVRRSQEVDAVRR